VKLRDILPEKRSAILEGWFEKTMETYPSESAGFLGKKNKQFSNPVGYTIAQGLEGLFDALAREEEFDPDSITPVLDDIMRIRALQGLPPSQELAFLFHLKRIVRDRIEGSGVEDPEGLQMLDSRIDMLALLSFDRYMQCREKIYELKANEAKNMTYRLLQRAKLVTEIKEQ